MSDTIEMLLDTLLICFISNSVEIQFERNAEPKRVVLLSEIHKTIEEFRKMWKGD